MPQQARPTWTCEPVASAACRLPWSEMAEAAHVGTHTALHTSLGPCPEGEQRLLAVAAAAWLKGGDSACMLRSVHSRKYMTVRLQQDQAILARQAGRKGGRAHTC